MRKYSPQKMGYFNRLCRKLKSEESGLIALLTRRHTIEEERCATAKFRDGILAKYREKVPADVQKEHGVDVDVLEGAYSPDPKAL